MDEVSKWDNTVEKNRTAEQLIFPLNKERVDIIDKGQIAQMFSKQTPLEMEVTQMVHGSDFAAKKEKSLTKAEQRAVAAMNLEEVDKCNFLFYLFLYESIFFIFRQS